MSDSGAVDNRPAMTVPGTVEKIIKPVFPGEPEKAEIALENADPLYREIRVENTLVDADGETVGLKKGAQVHVTIEADPEDTVKKSGVAWGILRTRLRSKRRHHRQEEF